MPAAPNPYRTIKAIMDRAQTLDPPDLRYVIDKLRLLLDADEGEK